MSVSLASERDPSVTVKEPERKETVEISLENNKKRNSAEAGLESFKLLLGNVGKYSRKHEVLKILKSSGFDESLLRNVKKYPKNELAIISFADEDSKKKAWEKLETLTNYKNGEPFILKEFVPNVITSEDFKGSPSKKRKCNNNGNENEKIGNKPSVATVEDAVAPLRELEYDAQLKKKQKNMVKALKKVKKETLKFELKCGRKQDQLPCWLQRDYMKKKPEPGDDRESNINDIEPTTEYNTGEIIGCCCPIEKIESAPVQTGYRNKCEFTVGYNSKNELCTGFRRGRFRDLDVSVEKATDKCMVVSKSMILVADAFTEFLKQSPLEPYNTIDRKGVWRQLTVRTTTKEENNHMLLMVQMKRDSIEDEGVLEKELGRLKDTFLGSKYDDVEVVSLNVCYYNGFSVQENAVPDVIYGSKVIVENLGDLKYNVSPGAFFQVNTRGAEVLYNIVGKFAFSDIPDEVAKQSVLLDVCCGTGTIGLSLASKVKHVIGVDLSESAIKDARENAILNSCDNATFVCSAAEYVLGSIVVQSGHRYEQSSKMEAYQKQIDSLGDEDKKALEQAKEILEASRKNGNPLIAIVDPPRGGLHPSVIRALRMAPKLEKVVYVSCNPTGTFIEDAKQLCVTPNSKRRPGTPYVPVKSVPVDMFPHTEHCELVTVFERKLSQSDE